MKRILISVALGFGIMVVAFFAHKTYGIRENILYSEEVINAKEAGEQSQNAYIARTEAIEIAHTAFGKGLGISLMDFDLSVHMNLYYDREDGGTYKWVMSWSRETTYDTYSCTIDAMDGRLLDLFVVEAGEKNEVLTKDELAEGDSLTEAEVLQLVKPFLNAIGISAADYTVQLEDASISIGEQPLREYRFTSTSDPANQFLMEIDRNTKKITSFERV